MATATVNNEGRTYCDINLTPLIDVMLVLLVIFIITIPVMTHAVKIDNPLPINPPLVKPDVIDLKIDFDGTVFWSKAPVDRATLQGYIRSAAAKSPQPEIHISVDRFARYEIVAQTLADLQFRGLSKIAFVNNEYY